MLNISVCGDAVRYCCTFSCYMDSGIAMRASRDVSSLGLHEVALNLRLNCALGSNWTLQSRLPNRPNRASIGLETVQIKLLKPSISSAIQDLIV